MNTNSTVTFKVAGNDVLSYVDKLKQRTDQLTADMITNAKKQSDSAKDQLRIVEDQINALERKNRIEAVGSRGVAMQQRDATKEVARAQYQAFEEKILGQGDKMSSFHRDKLLAKGKETLATRENVADEEFKKQLTSIRENERQSTLQTKLLKDNIEAIKSSSQLETIQMRKGDDAIVSELNESAQPTERLAKELAQERYEEGKKSPKEERGSGVGGSIFGSIASLDNLKTIMGGAGALTSTQNGFDMLGSTSRSIGTIVGTVLGGIIGSIIEPGGGTIVGAGLGGQIGGFFGGTGGDLLQRRAEGMQELYRSKYNYEATTQQGVDSMSSTSRYGVAPADFLNMMKQAAVAMGGSSKAQGTALDIIELERAVGVDKGTSNQLLSFFKGTQKDLSNLVKGIMVKGDGGMFRGGDFTYLNEFLNKFSRLQMQLIQTTDKVATGTTFDIMQRFNSVGGMFSSRDPRSEALMGQMQGALVNPQSDSLNAYSFLALRQKNPGLSLERLMEEKQKGLSSPTYLRAMLEQVDRLGGDESMKIINTAGAFGLQNNMAAARRLYENRKALMSGNLSTDQLEDMYKGEFGEQAVGKTTAIEQNMAEIKEGLLGTWFDSVKAMGSAFKNAVENALSGMTIESNGRTITLPKQNMTKVGIKTSLKDHKTKIEENIPEGFGY